MTPEEIVDELRVPHRRRLRPVPLRHVRHRVPQGAARRRLRRLPRDAVPADRAASSRPPATSVGLELNPPFFIALAQGAARRRRDQRASATASARTRSSRARPTARIEEAKKICLRRAARARRACCSRCASAAQDLRARSKVDRTSAKPKVSIIGEFWAMTTEGDGNYQLQRFLESEGAESDIQFVDGLAALQHLGGRATTPTSRAQLRGRRRRQVRPRAASASSACRARLGLWRRRAWRCASCFQTFAHAGRPLRLPPAGHGRGRRGRPRTTTTTICAAAKATWKSAS